VSSEAVVSATGAGRSPRIGPRIGLALAGGAPEGAIYEIGALRALDEALDGVDLNQLDIYVGVSSGALLASCLANGLSSRQMCRAALSVDSEEPLFDPDSFLRPSFREFARGGRALPRLAFEALWDYFAQPGEYTVLESFLRLSRALPVGLFDNGPVREYLERLFSIKRRTDDFRRLRKKLVVVAADLDRGREVRFGEPGFDHVPISLAVQASTALPGLYPPVEIEGRHYVDGILLKTLHASVALEAGAELVICVNPIVPVDTSRAVEAGVLRRNKLLDRGLLTVLSQTFRTLIHSRLEVGMASYDAKFPGADVILIEPERDDYKMFFTNVFGFSERRAIIEHAYDATRRTLLGRYDELAPVLARHGITLRRDVLTESRTLRRGVGLPPAEKPKPKAPPVRSVKTGEKESAAAVVNRLDAAMSRLDRLLGERFPAE
jgi:NTE family protein